MLVNGPQSGILFKAQMKMVVLFVRSLGSVIG